MTYTYRTATAADAARIDTLFIEMMDTIYHTDRRRGYDEGYLDRYFSGGEDRIFLAQCGGETVAFLSVEVHRDEAYIYLDDLSVTAAHRGRGVGTELFRLAEAYAESVGLSRIALHVEESNLLAQRLYRKLGYRENAMTGTRIRMVKDKGAQTE